MHDEPVAADGRSRSAATTEPQLADRGRRARGDQGAVAVEFALVGVLLFLLLFGIITYGFMMSMRQDLTMATAEAARAGAIAPAGQAQGWASDALNDALRGYFKTSTPCNEPGVLCQQPTIAACANEPSKQCITVTVSYDWKNHPRIPQFPGLGLVTPDRISSRSVAQINGA